LQWNLSLIKKIREKFMKRKKELNFPKSVLKKLVNDIRELIKGNKGKLFVLEMIEEIPYEIRHNVLENLSAFHESEIVDFFHLIKMEYGKEMEAVASRALEKLSMAGLDVSPAKTFEGSFFKAYVSHSRHTGRITLDAAWDTGKKGVHVECFYLTFNPDGVYNFCLIENMPLLKYEQDRKNLTDMVEVSFEESCYLVSEAYSFNVRFMSRPALGKFLYQKYLDNYTELSSGQERELIRKISKKLTPRQQINSFFYGLKNQDFNYLSSCISGHQSPRRFLFHYFDDILDPEVIFLEGQVEKIFGFNSTARVTGYSITVEDNEFYKNEYTFHLIKDETGDWLIVDIEKEKNELLDSNSQLDPFNSRLFCRVYKIADLDELFDVLDNVDNLRIVEELPYGVHMRITCYQDDFNHGISFFTGIIADIVINGNEFIVFAREHSNIMEFHEVLNDSSGVSLDFLGEYEISLLMAYSYMGGQYLKFEDALVDEENILIFEDGIRFLCARYLVKDIEQVKQRLKDWKTIQLEISDEYQVFYHVEKENEGPVFFAEYVLGSNWITVSTFGDHDMNIARKNFEDEICDCLEFNGMEVREEGIFEILTADVKKEYPGLEAVLKEIYLNKWYYSRLAILSGMSPSEACQTEEGSRLLWTMFKKINQKKKKKTYFNGEKSNIELKEYIQKVEQKRRENIKRVY